jgi:hypothetical protein
VLAPAAGARPTAALERAAQAEHQRRLLRQMHEAEEAEFEGTEYELRVNLPSHEPQHCEMCLEGVWAPDGSMDQDSAEDAGGGGEDTGGGGGGQGGKRKQRRKKKAVWGKDELERHSQECFEAVFASTARFGHRCGHSAPAAGGSSGTGGGAAAGGGEVLNGREYTLLAARPRQPLQEAQDKAAGFRAGFGDPVRPKVYGDAKNQAAFAKLQAWNVKFKGASEGGAAERLLAGGEPLNLVSSQWYENHRDSDFKREKHRWQEAEAETARAMRSREHERRPHGEHGMTHTGAALKSLEEARARMQERSPVWRAMHVVFRQWRRPERAAEEGALGAEAREAEGGAGAGRGGWVPWRSFAGPTAMFPTAAPVFDDPDVHHTVSQQFKMRVEGEAEAARAEKEQAVRAEACARAARREQEREDAAEYRAREQEKRDVEKMAEAAGARAEAAKLAAAESVAALHHYHCGGGGGSMPDKGHSSDRHPDPQRRAEHGGRSSPADRPTERAQHRTKSKRK